MGKTGKRAENLAALPEAGGLVRVPPPDSLRFEDLPPLRTDQLRELYSVMGGAENHFDRARPGGWDLAFDGGLIVELDEQQHFNRYRLLTLAVPWTASLPWTEPYIGYCTDRERECLRYGKGQQRWTNQSAERFFGVGAAPGVFDGVGSPRWRQRAFYDAIKDASTEVQLARVSVHDTVDGRSLEAVLRTRDLSVAEEVTAFVAARARA